ncbi:MAG TPA: hypothetical protein VM715_17930, partial [Candidatus Acidoferrum sp.]|nr:hypothetical protein [Candidatus Acidoferrum sp.]
RRVSRSPAREHRAARVQVSAIPAEAPNRSRNQMHKAGPLAAGWFPKPSARCSSGMIGIVRVAPA